MKKIGAVQLFPDQVRHLVNAMRALDMGDLPITRLVFEALKDNDIQVVPEQVLRYAIRELDGVADKWQLHKAVGVALFALDYGVSSVKVCDGLTEDIRKLGLLGLVLD